MKKFLDLPISTYDLSLNQTLDTIFFELSNEFLNSIIGQKIDILLEKRFTNSIIDYLRENLDEVFHKTTNYDFNVDMTLCVKIIESYSSTFINIDINLLEQTSLLEIASINKTIVYYSRTLHYEYQFTR